MGGGGAIDFLAPLPSVDLPLRGYSKSALVAEFVIPFSYRFSHLIYVVKNFEIRNLAKKKKKKKIEQS